MMNHKKLDLQVKSIAADYKRCEQELVSVITKIDRTKAFYKLGHSSLFAYMTKGLGLSEAVACNVSAVVRKSIEVPQLGEKVISGEIPLSKARKITPVLTKNNHKEWLDLAKSKTQKQIEREVSLAQPEAAVTEKTTYVPNLQEIKEKVEIKRNIPRIKVELGVSERLMLKLRRCQDLESQRQKRSVNLEKCLEALVDCYLAKNDPLKRAERQQMRGRLCQKPSVPAGMPEETETLPPVSAGMPEKTKTQPPVSDRRSSHGEPEADDGRIRRIPIPAKVRHLVQLRDQGRCTFRDTNGRRCSTRRFLEIHHIRPVHLGGDNELGNLRLLCHGHHKVEHVQW